MVRIFMVWLTVVLTLSSAAAQDYLLQPGDTIEVSVLEDPGLNRQVLVRPDGRISLPLAGTLDAAGRSPEQVQRLIRQALSRDFVEPPTVTVSLTRLGTPEPELNQDETIAVYVLGEVARPGRYDVERETDILQALAIAGGPGPFAARSRIQIRRGGDSGGTLLMFDYETIEDGLLPALQVKILDGDVIVVPERGLFD